MEQGLKQGIKGALILTVSLVAAAYYAYLMIGEGVFTTLVVGVLLGWVGTNRLRIRDLLQANDEMRASLGKLEQSSHRHNMYPLDRSDRKPTH